MSCVFCGWCCRFLLHNFSNDEKTKVFYQKRGMKVNQIAGKLLQMRQYDPCPHLGPDGKCKDYDNRPDVCREFPGNIRAEGKGFSRKKCVGPKCGYLKDE